MPAKARLRAASALRRSSAPRTTNVEAVIRRLYDGGYRGPLDIEREIEGEQQHLDIVEAIDLLRGIRAGLGL